MELSEEEKKAIEYLKENSLVRIENEKIVAYGNSYKLILLNLINNQQKEIEKIKQGTYAYIDDNHNVVVSRDYISKDKIREKIKELEKFDDGYNEDGEPELNWVVIEKINLLEELLEENTNE